MTTLSGIEYAKKEIESTPEGQYIHLWSSMPCTAGSPWQHMNMHRHPTAMIKIQKDLETHEVLMDNFAELAEMVIQRGGDVSIEWPTRCSLWKRDKTLEVLNRFGLMKVDFFGCGAGLRSIRTGRPIKKPWTVATSSPALAQSLCKFECCGEELHEPCAGQETRRTENYTPRMAAAIHKAMREQALSNRASIALTVIDQGIFEHDEASMELDDMPDPSGHREKNAAPGIWCSLVTKTLHPGDPLCQSPPALECVRSELEDLRSVPTWDEDHPVESDELKRTKPHVHVARIFPIIGVKNWEDPESHRWKGRIVLAGNLIKTAMGQWALFGEIGAVPSTMSACRALLAAYAITPDACLLQSDCLRAYTQAPMKGEETYIRLPKAWWPSHWVGRYKDPLCRLLRALYGHPDSGNHWADKLGSELKARNFKEVDGWSSVFVLDEGPEHMACIVVYVDDLIMFGSKRLMDVIRDLQKVIEMEEPKEIGKYLGVVHDIIRSDQGKHTITKVTYDMEKFFRSALEEYVKIAPWKLTEVVTPFAPRLAQDELDRLLGEEGKMASQAASLVMKLMYGVRMAWPHLCVIIGRLSSQITRWTGDSDRRLHRVYCYIHTNLHLKLRGMLSTEDFGTIKIMASPDADLAGDYMDTKSTSGFFIQVASSIDPARHMPLSWGSRKQGCTAQHTGEAETVALATCLRHEAIPLQHLLEEILRTPIDIQLCEDNAATIASILKGYSPAMKSMPRTHRISLGILKESITKEPHEGEGKINLIKVATAEHQGDLFTKEMEGPTYQRCLSLIGMQ